MAKLTLSVDEAVVRRAKEFADLHDTSVSALVERLLDGVTRVEDETGGEPPILRRLRGALRGADEGDYRAWLAEKYR